MAANKKNGVSIAIIAIVIVLLVIFKPLFNNENKQQKEKTDNKENTKGGGALTLKDIEDGYPKFNVETEEIVKHKAYHLSFNDNYKQANWCAYILTREMVKDNEAKRTDRFRPDPDVKSGSATPSDYKRSGFDRGHLVPAADMNHDAELMEETFLMSNMSPQVHEFNAGIWGVLEDQVRNWAVEYDSLYVVVGPELRNIKETIGKNKVGVPEYFFKVVLCISSQNGYKGIAFRMKHEGSENSIMDFAMSISDLEKELNCEFFPNLDKNVITSIKTKLDKTQWTLGNNGSKQH